MVKNIFLNGRVQTLFVFEDDENSHESVHPVFEALKAQAERIELLEQQNGTLIKQEHILLDLLKTTSKNDRIIFDTLQKMHKMLSLIRYDALEGRVGENELDADKSSDDDATVEEEFIAQILGMDFAMSEDGSSEKNKKA